mmetsp:Transcript_40392/g.94527  ORF Transcript_40392/g.94527 Transcript_40392/m.94527 type:complete len:273 (-) Transcript_40392:1127-1945(-)
MKSIRWNSASEPIARTSSGLRSTSLAEVPAAGGGRGDWVARVVWLTPPVGALCLWSSIQLRCATATGLILVIPNAVLCDSEFDESDDNSANIPSTSTCASPSAAGPFTPLALCSGSNSPPSTSSHVEVSIPSMWAGSTGTPKMAADAGISGREAGRASAGAVEGGVSSPSPRMPDSNPHAKLRCLGGSLSKGNCCSCSSCETCIARGESSTFCAGNCSATSSFASKGLFDASPSSSPHSTFGGRASVELAVSVGVGFAHNESEVIPCTAGVR